VFAPDPVKVVRFLAGWVLLSLTIPPFFYFPVLDFWLLPAGLCYLALLLFLPRLWLYVLPLAMATLGLGSVTGRPVFNELDFLVLLTLCSGLMYHRYRIQVYRPTGAIAILAAFVVIALTGLSSWAVFVAPPSQLVQNVYLTPDYGYLSIKGLLWALLLVPMWGHALSVNKRASMSALIRGICLAAIALLLGVLTSIGPASEQNRQLNAVLPLVPLFTPAVLYGCLHGRVSTRCLGAVGILSLVAVGISAGSILAITSIAIATAFFLALEWHQQTQRGRHSQRSMRRILAVVLGCFLIICSVSALSVFWKNSPLSDRFSRWQQLFSADISLTGSGAGSTALHYATIDSGEGRAPADFAAGRDGSTTIIAWPADPGIRIGQRLRIQPGRDYNLIARAHSEEGGTLTVALCERALTAFGGTTPNCVSTELHLPAEADEYTTINQTLHSGFIGQSPTLSIWPSEITLANTSAHGTVDIDFVALTLDDINRLRNSSFSEGLDHWFFRDAANNFPGQARNMYLQWLVEYGWGGLILIIALITLLAREYRLPHANNSLITVYISSVGSLCLYGLLESPLASGQVSWLFYFYLFSGIASLRATTTINEPRFIPKSVQHDG